MRSKAVAVLAGALLGAANLVPAGRAVAAPLVDVTFTDNNNDVANFVLTLGSSSNDIYQITGISGSFVDGDNGGAMTTILGLSLYASADNTFNLDGTLNDSVPYVTFSGLSFLLSDSNAINFFDDSTDGNGYGVLSNLTDPGGSAPEYVITSLSVTYVPEPLSASILLFGLGALGVARRGARARG